MNVVWWILAAVFAGGAVGGLVNAFLSDNGFALPRTENVDGVAVLRPGVLGNLLVGGVAACLSWGLYGSGGQFFLIGSAAPGAEVNRDPPGLTVAALFGAVLVGVGGARWLTSNVDDRLFRLAASQAAARPPDPELAARLGVASPAEAVRILSQADGGAADGGAADGGPAARAPLTYPAVAKLVEANNRCPAVTTALLTCLIWKESRFDPQAKNPTSTATGLMQVTRAAVEDVNKNTPAGTHFEHAEMTDPAKNIQCGSHYLRLRIERAGGDVTKGLEGFGTGPGYADNILACEQCLKGGPPDPTTCLKPIG